MFVISWRSSDSPGLVPTCTLTTSTFLLLINGLSNLTASTDTFISTAQRILCPEHTRAQYIQFDGKSNSTLSTTFSSSRIHLRHDPNRIFFSTINKGRGRKLAGVIVSLTPRSPAWTRRSHTLSVSASDMRHCAGMLPEGNERSGSRLGERRLSKQPLADTASPRFAWMIKKTGSEHVEQAVNIRHGGVRCCSPTHVFYFLATLPGRGK